MPDDTVPPSLRLAAAVAWRVLVIAALVVIIAFVVARLRIVFIPAFVALLLATQLSPLVDRVERHGLPRWLGALLSLLLGVVIVGGIGAAVVGTVVADFDRLEVDFEGGLDEIGDFLVDDLDIPRADVDTAIDSLLDTVRNNSGTILGGVFSGASLALEIAAGSILAVVLLFFFLKDGARMWPLFVALVPATRSQDLHNLGTRTWDILRAYFRGTSIVAMIDAVFIGIALLIIGVPLVLPLAVLTFFGGFIPIVGAVAAGVVAILVALVAEGLTEAILVALAVLAVQQLEGNVVAPVLVGRQLQMHPAVIILSVAAGGIIWGILGAAIAVPLVAVLTGVVGYLAHPNTTLPQPDPDESPAPEPAAAAPTPDAPT